FANNASPTFQDYIQYVAANCDSTYLYGIPDCFFMAPDFSTDEAFFAWVSDNCEGFSVDNIGGMAVDSNGNLGALATYYTAVARGEQLASGTTTAAIANQVIVYPNPVLNQATIQSKNTAIQTVSIYDAVGKLISSQSGLNTYQYQIATNGWTSGIYLVRIEAIDGTVSNQRINVVK
ncbi:MAG TPA: T9SS type A sorting domain-containing protein, partial [Chitinophagales bacterium]|nr:T9SS type A sorting domain-containing protein [Chitinophagales bacterium]